MPLSFPLWILLGLGVFFAVLTLILRITGGYAPGWQLRCTTCGHTRDAGKAGLIRIGAFSVGQRILGHCSKCGGLELALERKALDMKPKEA